jgi:hypothetical protein
MTLSPGCSRLHTADLTRGGLRWIPVTEEMLENFK